MISILFAAVDGMRVGQDDGENLYSFNGEAGALTSVWYTKVWLWTLMWSAIIVVYEFVICRWLFEYFALDK